MKKIILTYGLIAGAIVTAFMAGSVFYMTKNPDWEGSMYLGFAGMIVSMSFVFIGVKKYRDNYNDGRINFGEAIKIGALISLIASTIYVGVWLIEYYNIYPDFMDKYSAAELKKISTSTALTPDEIKSKTEQILQMKEMYKSPIWVILFTYMEIVPVGLLATLVSALILKKKQVAST